MNPHALTWAQGIAVLMSFLSLALVIIIVLSKGDE